MTVSTETPSDREPDPYVHGADLTIEQRRALVHAHRDFLQLLARCVARAWIAKHAADVDSENSSRTAYDSMNK